MASFGPAHKTRTVASTTMLFIFFSLSLQASSFKWDPNRVCQRTHLRRTDLAGMAPNGHFPRRSPGRWSRIDIAAFVSIMWSFFRMRNSSVNEKVRRV
ncbi:hypothetical protein V8E55_008254 [Tylopilus felleus]